MVIRSSIILIFSIEPLILPLSVAYRRGLFLFAALRAPGKHPEGRQIHLKKNHLLVVIIIALFLADSSPQDIFLVLSFFLSMPKAEDAESSRPACPDDLI